MNKAAIEVNFTPGGTIKKLKKRLLHSVGDAIARYGMVEDGDRIMVCMSGGKDSYVLLDMLLDLQKKRRSILNWWRLTLIRNSPVFPNMFYRTICVILA